MNVRIGAVVIHCFDFDRMVAFWREALHYVPRNAASGDWVVLCDPTGRGPNLSFQARDRRAGRRSWYIWTFTLTSRKQRWSAWLRLEQHATRGDIRPEQTTLFWKILTAIFFASFKNPKGPNKAMQPTADRATKPTRDSFTKFDRVKIDVGSISSPMRCRSARCGIPSRTTQSATQSFIAAHITL